MEDKIKEILERETKGININKNTRNNLIFSYDDAEGMLRELEKETLTCQICNKEHPKILMSIECPDCYKKGLLREFRTYLDLKDNTHSTKKKRGYGRSYGYDLDKTKDKVKKVKDAIKRLRRMN